MIIIILNLGFDTSKNKIIDHQGNENCAYESDQSVFTLWFYDAKCTKCLFFIYFTATQKKKIILEEK